MDTVLMYSGLRDFVSVDLVGAIAPTVFESNCINTYKILGFATTSLKETKI